MIITTAIKKPLPSPSSPSPDGTTLMVAKVSHSTHLSRKKIGRFSVNHGNGNDNATN